MKIFETTRIQRSNLVLGAVRGYDFEQLRPFVVSLKRTTFKGDLVLLWNNLSSETLVALGDHGVKLVHFEYRGSGLLNSWSRFWPMMHPALLLPVGNSLRKVLYKKMLNLAVVRYFHALDFLEANIGHYNNILLTDVRDVIFQDDPFRDPLPRGITAFLEAPKNVFGEETLYNDPWIRDNYGELKLRQLTGQRISCCGTVMGTETGMLEYLRAFFCEIIKLRSVAHGADTSIHNVLVREVLREHATVVENLQGAVATIGSNFNERLQLEDGGLVLGPSGCLVPVLHQYDRHPELANSLMNRLL